MWLIIPLAGFLPSLSKTMAHFLSSAVLTIRLASFHLMSCFFFLSFSFLITFLALLELAPYFS